MSESAVNAEPNLAGGVPPAPVPVGYASPDTKNVSGETFGARSARGGMILTAMSGMTAVLNFGTQLVLAHFLLPSEFGVVAVAFSISGLVAVLRDAGAPAILIQRQNEFDRIAGSVFWLTLISATLCALLTAAAGPIVAHYKGNPILIPIFLLTAVRFPIGVFGTVSSARLSIDLRWGAVALSNFLQPLVTGLVAVAMAWRGFGIYSLVVPAICGDAARGAAAWWAAKVHAPLRPQWSFIRPIVSSSIYIVLTNLTLAIRGFGDYLTLSFITRDDNQTGLYLFAFNMSQALSRLSLGSLPAVVAPVFSKVKHDEDRHADVVISAIHSFAAIGVLPIVLQMVLAEPMFRLFFAAKWQPAAPLFAIITLMVLACFINGMLFQAMWANGLYKEFLRYSLIFTPFMVACFVVCTLLGGATGVAWANVIAAAADFAIFPLFALPLLRVPWKRAITPLWRPLVAAIPAAICAWLLRDAMPTTAPYNIARIVIVGIVGSLGYLCVLLLIWRDVTMQVINRVLGAIGVARP